MVFKYVKVFNFICDKRKVKLNYNEMWFFDFVE